MGPVSVTSKNWGGGAFNFVIGGSRLEMLHHLALVPLPLIDGKQISFRKLPEIVSPKNKSFGGGLGSRDTSLSRKSSEKGPQNGSGSAKLSREKSYLMTWLQTKDSTKGFVDGDKGRTINIL